MYATEEMKVIQATRNIMLFVIGKFSSLLGASIYNFAIGLYVLKLTGSGMNFAITIVCGMVPRILLGPFVGALADRINRKKLVIGADICSAIIMFSVGVFSLIHPVSLPVIYVSCVLLAVCATCFSIAFTSSLPSLVDDQRLQKAGALNQAASSLSSILGPVIAGILYGTTPLSVFVFVTGVAFFISACASALIVFDLYQTKEKEKSMPLLKSIVEGFEYVQQNRMLFSIVKTAFFVNFFFCALLVSLPYITINHFHLSPKQYGIIEGMFAVGMLLTSLIFSSRKEVADQIKVVRLGLSIMGVLIVLTSLPIIFGTFKSVTFIYYILLMFLIGVTIVAINIPIQMFVQRTTAEVYRGRVFGLVETIATAISPLGLMLFGLLCDYISAFWLPFLAGSALLLVANIAMRKSRMAKARSVTVEG
ncbi:MFS transporter [Ectobacillus antri]|uniref:MFS transporter n=1 Tax=Ectobacillus antri TaxID=2486280 RepID=A0ABT6H1D0_9BACI|nr:MFS transporter [Ectobacillus antri]MDG4655451.1 MFS transporter [Ectobacillus antri]MDG5753209.1 MFS transporter [Ectobacillus antri]